MGRGYSYIGQRNLNSPRVFWSVTGAIAMITLGVGAWSLSGEKTLSLEGRWANAVNSGAEVFVIEPENEFRPWTRKEYVDENGDGDFDIRRNGEIYTKVSVTKEE